MANNVKLTMVIDAKTGEVKTAIGGVITDIKTLDREAGKAGASSARSFGKTRAGVESVSNQLQRARKEVRAFIAAHIGLDVVGKIREMMDGWQSVTAQLKVATQSQQQYAFATEEVYRIAQSTGAQLESTGQLYARLTTSILEMGGQVEHASIVTQAMNDALKISKASTAEAASAQIQFSQAIASGVLRGEEFNAVNEAAPALMQALARELGVTRGELRGMAEQGQLTADVVLPAIMRASSDLAETSKRMGDTMGASWQKVVNAMQRWIGRKDEAIGASRAISGALSGIARNFDLVADAVARGAAVLTAAWIIKMGKARAATLGFGTALTAAQAKLLQFTVRATGSITAVKLMTGAVKGLGLAVRSVFPLFLAYEIGKYLWDNFEVARRAMRTTVAAFANGWERIKFGFTVAGAAMKATFLSVFDKIKRGYAKMLEVMAAGFDKIGATDIAAGLEEAAAKVRENADAWTEFGKTYAAAYQNMTASIELNKAVLEEALNADHAEFEAKKQLGGAVVDVDKALQSFNVTAPKSKAEIKAMERETKRAAKETEKLGNEYRALLRELNPLQAESDAYAEKLDILNQAMERGWISTGEYEEAVWALDQKMLGFGDDAEEVAQKVEKAADPMAESWKRALERIDASFANAFKGAFRSFRDFARDLRESFKTLLAELAYSFVKSRFMQMLGNSKGGFMQGVAGLIGVPAGGAAGGVPALPAAGSSAGGALSTLGVMGLYAGGGILGAGQGANKISAGLGGMVGGSLGMIFGGPFGAALGSAIGGALTGWIGAKWRDAGQGVDLSFSGGDVSGQQWTRQKKRGLFRNKSRMQYEALQADIEETLQAGIDQWKALAESMGQIYGRTSEKIRAAINAYTAEAERLELKGLDPQEVQARLQAWVNNVGAQLLEAVVPEISGIIRAAGDRAGELMQPLLQLANYISADFAPSMAQSLKQADDMTLKAVMEAAVALESRGVTEDQIVGLTRDLAAKAQARYQFEVELLQLIQQVKADVSATVAGFKDQVFRETATTQQLIDEYTRRKNEAFLALQKATDPEEIRRLTKEAIAAAQAGFALATEEEKKALAESMNRFADSVDATAKARLQKVESETIETHKTTAEIVSNALQRASRNQDTAAANLNTAAVNLNTAAQSLVNASGAVASVPSRYAGMDPNIAGYYRSLEAAGLGG